MWLFLHDMLPLAISLDSRSSLKELRYTQSVGNREIAYRQRLGTEKLR